ncbi:hypothetical protein [Longimicrobium sp.]|uniref:hypothetical protein n=1 Tax=Longimicrobium sp. TaxID=2029185 RepID=UPI002CAC4510|nr:hypothetical protein [Longimicrobium sp.]HSU13557.1 hypothetical protein [Longimicrobium sp.]
MDAPGDPAEPDPGVDPAAAFFGLWPRIAEPTGDQPAHVIPLHARPRVIAHEPPRLRIA